MTEKFYHPDDIWTPINKPTDPCQVHGCQCKKHQFPFHWKQEEGLDTGTLSRWCLIHTIEKGFCHRCERQEVWHKDIGLCRECERYMTILCDKEGVTVKQFVDKMKQDVLNNPSPFVIRIN